MAKWFYYNPNGNKIEVTGRQLKELAKTGQITPGTLIESEAVHPTLHTGSVIPQIGCHGRRFHASTIRRNASLKST